MLEIVIDTNLCISALLNPGNPQRVIDLLTDDRLQAFYQAVLLEQLRDVAARPKLALRISKEALGGLMKVIEQNATPVTLGDVPSVSRDPTDDAFLECARVENCDYLVTGGKDLLVLQKHGRTRIVTPAEFLSTLVTQVKMVTSQRYIRLAH